MSTPPWVQETIGVLTPVTNNRPTLQPALLERPPFRFVHHIVTSVLKNTGVPAGLYTSFELRAKNYKTKQQKTQFVEKLIAFCELAGEQKLAVRTSKLLAGLEADKSNELLQAFGRIAQNADSYDVQAISAAVLKARGEETTGHDGQAGGGLDNDDADQGENEDFEGDGTLRSTANIGSRSSPGRGGDAGGGDDGPDGSADFDALADAEVARAVYADHVSPDDMVDHHGPHTHAAFSLTQSPVPGEGSESSIERTQRLLGSLIAAPQLLAQRLVRPRFKFLHDIVLAVMAKTGFPEGLYDDEERNSETVQVRYKFIKKLIECVSLVTNTEPPLRELVEAKKVTAGLNPERTNLMLQHLAVAAAAGACSHQVVDYMRDAQIARSQRRQPPPFSVPIPPRDERLQARTRYIASLPADSVVVVQNLNGLSPDEKRLKVKAEIDAFHAAVKSPQQQPAREQGEAAPAASPSPRRIEALGGQPGGQSPHAVTAPAHQIEAAHQIFGLQQGGATASGAGAMGQQVVPASLASTAVTVGPGPADARLLAHAAASANALAVQRYPGAQQELERQRQERQRQNASNMAFLSEPEGASGWYERGLQYADRGLSDDAIRAFSKALELNPMDPLYRYHRALVYSDLRQPQAAIADLNEAIKLDSRDASFYDARGNAHCDMRELPHALSDYTTAIRLDSTQASFFNNRGLVHDELGDLNAALSDYSSAIQLDPTVASVFYHRGVVLYEKGLPESAVKDFTQAIKLAPNVALCYCNRGAALYELGRHAEAIHDYSTAIELSPNNAVYYNNRGAALYDLERFDEAIDDYSKAVELNPDDPLCYANRGRLFYQQGQWDAAVVDYTKAIALSPNDASFHNNRAFAYDKLGNLDAAIYDMTMAVELAQKPQYKKKLAKLKGRNSHY